MDVVVHVSLTSDRLTWHLMARLAGSASGFCSCPIQSLVSDAPHQRSTMPYRINGREKTGSANIMAFHQGFIIERTSMLSVYRPCGRRSEVAVTKSDIASKPNFKYIHTVTKVSGCVLFWALVGDELMGCARTEMPQ